MLLLLAAAPAGVEARAFDVNTPADHKPGKCNARDCTLREAVIRANERDGYDRIKIPAELGPYELTRAGAGEDEAQKGDLDLLEAATDIKGTGGRAVIRQTVEDRVIHTNPSDIGDFVLTRLTLTGGSGVPAGGALLAEQDTFFSSGVIRDNRAGVGGGVAVVGSDSRFGGFNNTITDNRATSEGGGLFVSGPDGVGTGVNLSTVARNRAPTGAGVYAALGDANLAFNNSTVALNRATSESGASGGGIYTAVSSGTGVTILGHTTIASNEASTGAANLQALDAVQMENTIVAQSLGGAPSCTFDVDSFGWNLDQEQTCGLDQGTDLQDAEPGLKPLGDYGGPTETMALKASSDALEQGDCPGTLVQFGVDQRGESRGPTGPCDIGAFERPGG